MYRAQRRTQRHEQASGLDGPVEVVRSPAMRWAAVLAALLLLGLFAAALASGGLKEVQNSIAAAGILTYRTIAQAWPAQPTSAARQDTQLGAKPTTAHVPAWEPFEVANGKAGKIQIVDEPLPAECNARQHADYGGDAVQWGLGHKARSAAECCKRCQNFRVGPNRPWPCNMWTWCGDPSGKCWTMDIHNHTTGDCWLKFQKTWDNSTDYDKTNLVVNHLGRFTPEFRKEHKTAPEFVPWVSGVIVRKD